MNIQITQYIIIRFDDCILDNRCALELSDAIKSLNHNELLWISLSNNNITTNKLKSINNVFIETKTSKLLYLNILNLIKKILSSILIMEIS